MNKFTILACYCIYFSDSALKYAHMFMKVSEVYRIDEDTNDQIAEAAGVAIKLMQPVWNNKAHPSISREAVNVSALEKELRLAEEEYKSAELRGGQLYMKINKEKIERLRKRIGNAQRIK